MALFRISNMGVRPALTAVLRYGLALASVGAALGLSITLVHYHLPRLFGAFSSAAIAISFWYAGMGPGILAILASCSAFYFLLSPVTEVKGPEWESFVIIYTMLSVLVGWSSISRRRAERLLADARDNLESRVAEQTSELALANQELRRTQAYMDQTQKLTHTGTCVWRVSTREYIYWSDEMFRIFGLEPQKTLLPYQSTLEMLHPDDRPQFERIAEQAIASKSSGEMDFRVVRPDGSVRHMRAVFHAVLDQAGNVVELWRTGLDITERRQAEEAIRGTEERWRVVFENSAVGIALTDPQGKYVGSNRAYQEMLGYTDEELRGMSYLDITYEEDLEINRALSIELWEGKQRQFQLEKRYQRKDGSRIWVRATISVAPGAQGKSRFGMAIVEDVTERKRAEEALRRSEAYLAAGQGLSHTGSWALNMAGLQGQHQGSKPRRATPGVQARVIRRAQQKPSDGSTHWSCRKLAEELGVSKSTVQRILAQAKLRPHRLDRYMASNDPDFEAKAADIIGLYLNPPQHAAVFCVDEKTAIQALDRLDPVLPLSPGRAERHGFEYHRHGTLSLYAALNVKTGKVEGKTARRHTSVEFVGFLTELVGKAKWAREIHIVLDNLSAHKTEAVEKFLADHSKVGLHFTPTYSSWLNQVEIWFAKIERDVIARGVFTSVSDLRRKLMKYIRAHAERARPIRWTYTDVKRRISAKRITGTAH